MAEQELRKMRPMYVAQFLARKADDKTSVTTTEILDYLYETYQISADRKTIYRDIKMLRDQFGMDIQKEQYGQGYCLMSRQFELDDLKILAECVYAARFISEKRTEDLIDLLCELCSEQQEEILKRDLYSTERIKTTQDSTLRTISKIRQSIKINSSSRRCGCKISFKYLTHTIDNIHLSVEKHDGKVYTVSPYKLFLNDGEYYLLAYEDDSQEMRTYRIDRMSEVSVLDERISWKVRFLEDDTKNYLQQSFSMFGGELTKVSMCFDNSLLDTVLDKFGTGAVYEKVDDNHFTVTTKVNVSGQFFGWLCGFGTKAKLIGPEDTVEEFRAYMDEIRKLY